MIRLNQPRKSQGIEILADIPLNPKIYHITHQKNLPQMIQSGVLWSDAKRIQMNLDCEIVGMDQIKNRRLHELQVSCHPGTMVGEYVPFYFCPRSIMLYILHKGNLPDLKYTEGQEPIVHLQADLRSVVNWAHRQNRRWAFTDRNAGIRYTFFSSSLNDLRHLNWAAIHSDQWGDSITKEGKQAEFLLYESFPWELIEKIGVHNQKIADEVKKTIASSGHCPIVSVQHRWYY